MSEELDSSMIEALVGALLERDPEFAASLPKVDLSQSSLVALANAHIHEITTKATAEAEQLAIVTAQLEQAKQGEPSIRQIRFTSRQLEYENERHSRLIGLIVAAVLWFNPFQWSTRFDQWVYYVLWFVLALASLVATLSLVVLVAETTRRLLVRRSRAKHDMWIQAAGIDALQAAVSSATSCTSIPCLREASGP